MIEIHIDYVDGTEVSYIEGLVSYIEGLELLYKDPKCNFTTTTFTDTDTH